MLKTLLILGVTLGLALSHVRLRQPPNRSSVWRDPNFAHLNPTPNYNDDGLYCGRIHQEEVVTNCGICGDPVSDPTPRDNENGGTYGQGIIVGRYAPGEVIPISLEFTIAHLGFFEMQICDRIPETEDCFRRLTFGNGETRLPVPVQEPIWVNTTLQLPTDIRCDQCTLRLNYRAGNNWHDCGNGTEGMGCGLQETFRSCADISIA